MPEYQLPQLLSKAALCSQLAISVRTLENLVRAGHFPPPVRIGKHVFWTHKSVFIWQQALFSNQESWEPA